MKATMALILVPAKGWLPSATQEGPTGPYIQVNTSTKRLMKIKLVGIRAVRHLAIFLEKVTKKALSPSYTPGILAIAVWQRDLSR